MLKIQSLLSPLLLSALLCACVVEHNNPSGNRFELNPPSFDQIVSAFSSDYRSLELPDLQLSFVGNLQSLGIKDDLNEQMHIFEKHSAILATVDADALDLCSRIDFSIMQTETALNLRRAKLGLRFLKYQAELTSAKRLSDLPLGTEWYEFYLDRWNGADLDTDDIYAFGQRNLQHSVAQYDAIQSELGFAGDDAGLARHLSAPIFQIDGGDATLKLFREKQTLVWQNLSRLFSKTYTVKPATISRSDRGRDFPVPGYYNSVENTFYYNLVENGFKTRQADWLYLHEGTPGHHFQISAASVSLRCASRLPELSHAAYREGWAAYVETLGEDLGLYSTLEAKLAAVEWDMVRSVRVVLDVGLNAYNWSDEQALAYWQENVRGQLDIAQREIDRMKRWPAQVITYKFGADVFQKTKAVVLSNNNERRALYAFHDAAISYGPMPLETFQALHLELARAAH